MLGHGALGEFALGEFESGAIPIVGQTRLRGSDIVPNLLSYEITAGLRGNVRLNTSTFMTVTSPASFEFPQMSGMADRLSTSRIGRETELVGKIED